MHLITAVISAISISRTLKQAITVPIGATKTQRPLLRCEKDKTIAKPNARRARNGLKGASKTTIWTLAQAWHAHESGVRAAVILVIGNDGHCTVRYHADDSTHKGVRRALLCIESAFDRSSAAEIASLTTTDRPEDRALLMRRKHWDHCRVCLTNRFGEAVLLHP